VWVAVGPGSVQVQLRLQSGPFPAAPVCAWGTCLLQVGMWWGGGNGRTLHFAVVMLGGKAETCKKEIFYSENNQSLKQPPQGGGRVPNTGGFQDVLGQGAR